MHRRTYERTMERIYAAEEIADTFADLALDQLLKDGRAASR